MLGNNRMAINISIDETFKKSFGYPSLYEIANDKAILYIINNWKEIESQINKDWDIDYKPKAVLTKYYNNYKKDKLINIKYKKSENYESKIGRFFCNSGIGIQSLPREIRHTICKGLYIDLDFVNCHPSILIQLCEFYNIECPNLKFYVNNRNEVLIYICDGVGCDKARAKKIFLCALNGNKTNYSNVKNWKSTLLEFNNIHEQLANKPEFNFLLEEVKKVHIDDNINARVVNRILCYIENECLKVLFKILDEYKCFNYELEDKIYKVCALCFDGLQSLDNKNNRALFTQEFFKMLSTSIKNKVGFYLDIAIKEFDEVLSLPDNFEKMNNNENIINDDFEAMKYIVKIYGDNYIICNGIHYIKNGYFWTNDKFIIEKNLNNNIYDCNMKIRCGDNTRGYSGFASHLNKCRKLILSNGFKVDDNFISSNLKKSLYYLPYRNCVYCFKDGKTYNYDELPDINFTSYINRDFPKFNENDYEELLEKVLNPIYPNEEERNFNAHCKARALAGCYKDKYWYAFTGERNSGKGCETQLLRSAFKSFVLPFDAKCLINNKFGNATSETALAWVVDKANARIIISNEIDENAVLNGSFIKLLASGGDEIEARKLFSNLQILEPQFTMFLCCNSLPKPAEKGKDCLQTLINFEYKSVFVNKEEYEKNKDVCSYYKLADNNIKSDLLTQDRIIDAYSWYIFKNFNIERQQIPQIILEDMSLTRDEDDEETLQQYIQNNYSNSDNNKDCLSVQFIFDDITAIDKFSNLTKDYVSKVFKKMNIGVYNEKIPVDGKRVRGYRGILKKN